MVLPLFALAVLAFVVIKSLMGVVAHDDAAAPATADAPLTSVIPTAAWGDDARAFLLPAAEVAVVDQDVTVPQ